LRGRPSTSHQNCGVPREPFGDGGEPRSSLVGHTYAGGQGPGVYVAARDGFRVYLNGDLVVASTAVRQAVFVPLTLLPGDNALAVVVAAKVGTPAALVQVDDLDQSYVSGATWKVSTAPSRGFASASYDDSAWSFASDYGTEASLPGCAPGAAFPSDTSAHWIGPAANAGSTAVLRTVIRLAAIGFGSGTSGGSGATPVTVRTWSDLKAAAQEASSPAVILLPEGVHDFRGAPRNQPACPSACTDKPTMTEYTVLVGSETCAAALVAETRDERTLVLGSNKTIVGLGRGAALQGVSLDFGSSSNTIVRNVALFDVNPALIEAGDGFSLGGTNRVWLDHCTAKWISSTFTNIGAGAENVTLSWMHFDGVTPYECDGERTLAVTVNGGTATIHHSFFDHVESHSPTVQNAPARVHLFDNLMSDNPSYAVESECGSQVLMQANTFQRVATPTERDTCVDGGVLGRIQAPFGSNYYGEDVGPNHGGDGGEPHDPVFTPPYSYAVDPPRTEWVIVLARAGAGGPWALPLSLP
jgi:pectate lyase